MTESADARLQTCPWYMHTWTQRLIALYTHTHTQTYIYIYIHMHACLILQMHACKHVRDTCIRGHSGSSRHTHTHTHIYICTHDWICRCTLANMSVIHACVDTAAHRASMHARHLLHQNTWPSVVQRRKKITDTYIHTYTRTQLLLGPFFVFHCFGIHALFRHDRDSVMYTHTHTHTHTHSFCSGQFLCHTFSESKAWQGYIHTCTHTHKHARTHTPHTHPHTHTHTHTNSFCSGQFLCHTFSESKAWQRYIQTWLREASFGSWTFPYQIPITFFLAWPQRRFFWSWSLAWVSTLSVKRSAYVIFEAGCARKHGASLRTHLWCMHSAWHMSIYAQGADGLACSHNSTRWMLYVYVCICIYIILRVCFCLHRWIKWVAQYHMWICIHTHIVTIYVLYIYIYIFVFMV